MADETDTAKRAGTESRLDIEVLDRAAAQFSSLFRLCTQVRVFQFCHQLVDPCRALCVSGSFNYRLIQDAQNRHECLLLYGKPSEQNVWLVRWWVSVKWDAAGCWKLHVFRAIPDRVSAFFWTFWNELNTEDFILLAPDLMELEREGEEGGRYSRISCKRVLTHLLAHLFSALCWRESALSAYACENKMGGDAVVSLVARGGVENAPFSARPVSASRHVRMNARMCIGWLLASTHTCRHACMYECLHVCRCVRTLRVHTHIYVPECKLHGTS